MTTAAGSSRTLSEIHCSLNIRRTSVSFFPDPIILSLCVYIYFTFLFISFLLLLWMEIKCVVLWLRAGTPHVFPKKLMRSIVGFFCFTIFIHFTFFFFFYSILFFVLFFSRDFWFTYVCVCVCTKSFLDHNNIGKNIIRV